MASEKNQFVTKKIHTMIKLYITKKEIP